MFTNGTFYEWVVETLDEYGDIVDADHSDTLKHVKPLAENEMLGLVRDVYRDDELVDRTWAYVKDGRLPERFGTSDGGLCTKVPKRFQKEFEQWKNSQ